MEKEMATHSSVLAWRIPGTGKPGGLQSVGSHRVGHDWSDLAAAAAVVAKEAQLLFCSIWHGLEFMWKWWDMAAKCSFFKMKKSPGNTWIILLVMVQTLWPHLLHQPPLLMLSDWLWTPVRGKGNKKYDHGSWENIKRVDDKREGCIAMQVIETRAHL